jgi:AcrR family transcriptional regulator
VYQTERDLRHKKIILEQAAGILADNPARTMQEIADLLMVGRTTLYRYFKNREELARAIWVQAIDEVADTIRDSRLEEGEAGEALRRVIQGLIAIGDRYRVLFSGELLSEACPDPEHHAGAFDPTGKKAMLSAKSPEMDALGAGLRSLVERGQREGAFDPAMPARWIVSVMGSLIVSAQKLVQEGELARNHAADLVADTLLRGVQTALFFEESTSE